MSQSTTCASTLSNTSASQPGASQDSQVDFVDLARRYPRDVFIRHVNDYANFDDLSVGKIRSDLFDIASNREDFPAGSLKTRRNRRAGESIGNKLAADCHALCMFILGGPSEDISDLLSSKHANSSILCTPSESVSLESPAVSRDANILYEEEIAGLRADLLLLSSELMDATSANRSQFDVLKTELKSMSKRFQTYDKLDRRISSLENKQARELEKLRKCTNEFKSTLSIITISIDSLTKQQNELKTKTNAAISKLECDLQLRENEHEIHTSRLKNISNDQKLHDSRLSDVVRQINNLKEPCDSAVSSLKGEFKILRQNIKHFNDDIESAKTAILSNKQSITTIRNKLSSSEQNIASVKQQHNELISCIMSASDEPCKAHTHNQRTEVNKGPTTVVAEIYQPESAPQPNSIPRGPSPKLHSRPDHPRPDVADKAPPTVSTPTACSPQRETTTCKSTPPPADVFLPRIVPAVLHQPHHSKPVSPPWSTEVRGPRHIPVVCSSIWSLTEDDTHGFIAARRPSATGRTRQFYIGNIDKSVDAEAISAWMEARNAVPVNIKMLPGKRDWITGAKITVRKSDLATIGADNFWPTGVYIRTWEYRR